HSFQASPLPSFRLTRRNWWKMLCTSCSPLTARRTSRKPWAASSRAADSTRCTLLFTRIKTSAQTRFGTFGDWKVQRSFGTSVALLTCTPMSTSPVRRRAESDIVICGDLYKSRCHALFSRAQLIPRNPLNSSNLGCEGAIIMRWTFHSLATCLIVLLIARFAMGQHDFSKIEFSILEKKTGKPVPCRVHIKDKNGKPQRAGALPFWYDHFVCQGAAQLQLPSGEYSYEVERGPEYAMATGTFMVKEKDQEKVNVELERLLDLTKEGWWSGDLHVHRPVTDIELLMRAEDIHLAPVFTWWNNRNEWAGKALPENPLFQFDQNRYYHVMAGEDEREGGALLYFNLQQPLAITDANREH